MTYHAVVKSSVANTAAAMTIYKDAIVAMGWTLDDDQSAATPPYYIFKSSGESGSRFPCYYRLRWHSTANRIDNVCYLHWDNSSQTGTVQFGNQLGHYLDVDDDGPFTVWAYGDKDRIALVAKLGTYYDGIGLNYLDSFYKAYGTLASGATAGNDKVLQLGTGEADDFVVGEDYQVVGSATGEARETVEVTVVDTANHRVTVDNLARALSTNSRIARIAHLWAPSEFHSGQCCILDPGTSGTGTYNTTAHHMPMILVAAMDPNSITGKYDFYYDGVKRSNYCPYGMLVSWPNISCGTGKEHTISVDEKATGQSTGSNTSTTLNDTGEAWTIDEWDGYCLIITGGTSAGEMREIASNTATEITVTSAFVATPDASSTYAIAKKGYRYFYFSTALHPGFKEIDGGV